MKIINKNRQEKGITLVALVVTIIIMLILAGVVIKGITQGNGIIKETNEAVILSSLKEVDAALEQYSISKAGEKAKQGDYAGEISLEELISEGILKKVEVEDTLRTIGVITDLDKIGIQGKLGKKGKSIEKEKIGSLSEIKDVYAIDCEDNMLYYIKGNVWNLEGMKEIAKLNEREAQKRKFITRWEVTEENKIIELPLRKEKWSSYYRYDCKIEVIDSNGELEKEINIKDHIKELDENGQTQSIKMDYDAFEAARTIECKSVGRYEIRISGLCEEFNFSKKATSKDVIQEIVSFGEVGIKVLDLTGATNITSIPEPTDKSFKEAINISFAQTQISKIPNNLLASATNLEQVSFAYTKIEEIPADLLKNNINLTSVASLFQNTNITSIPENLFENNKEITSFNSTFAECRQITEIPEILFKNNTKVTTFQGTFRNTKITKIPETLFANNPEVLEFGNIGSVGWRGTFCGCAGITEIPENLFANNVKTQRFGGVFRQTSIKTIPKNIFKNNTQAKSFEATFHGTPLEEIPENLFDNNINVESFHHVFAYDSKIKTIPQGLFKYNVKANTFESAFVGCNSITEIPQDLFETTTEVTSFTNTFSGCRNLKTIPIGLFDNNTKVTTFDNCFRGTPITEIPQGLFDKNIEVTNFSNTFWGCGKLTTIPSGVFDNNTKVTTFESCFRTCSVLEEIPQNLFKGKDTANTKSLFLETKVTEDVMKNAGLTEEQIANAKI